MANIYRALLKFCVFCSIFFQYSQSNELNSVDAYYHYELENSDSLKYTQLDLNTLRVKRDISQTSTVSTATTLVTSSTSSPLLADKQNANGVPINLENTPHLLGANGTGQRKDYASRVAMPDAFNADAKAQAKKPLLGAVIPKSSDATENDEYEKVVDTIDESLEAINKTINEHLANSTLNSTLKSEYFQYYNSSMFIDKDKSNEYWSENRNYTVSTILSNSHRRAITVQLKFDFPFYGHTVRNVTVATGGFLYTGEYVHSWLAATQYIAPLMANFDTSMSNLSIVKYADNGTAFTVVWEQVPLQDNSAKNTSPTDAPKPTPAPNDNTPVKNGFTFSVTLMNTGDIIFAYKTIPISIESIKDEKHPVKIGLSDAYIIDKTIYFARRKTIYEYHRVNFNGQEIQNHTLIVLEALPTCLEHKDCVSCLETPNTSFDCSWCPNMNRCSTGTDRKRQHWLQNGCERTLIKASKMCPLLGSKGNNYSSEQQITAPSNGSNEQLSPNTSVTQKSIETDSVVKKAAFSHADGVKSKQSNVNFVLGIFLPIILVLTLIMWAFYAYRNPHTKSGQLLIQYRPSTWSWRRGEARYTAATIHM